MKLTKKDFRAWLKSISPRSIVGRSGSASCCPIAQYLKSAGYKRPTVDDINYLDNARPLTERSTPLWASRFIDVLDRDDEKDITAINALKILNARPVAAE